MELPLAEISPTAVAAATFLNMIAGMVWYHPKVLGDRWMRLVKLDPEKAKEGMRRGMFIGILATLTGAVFIAVLHAIATPITLIGALGYGVLWVQAFLLPVHVGTVAWEQRPVELACINFGWSVLSIAITITTVHVWPL